MNIPIQNVYYLLIYAWDVLDEAELVDVNVADKTSLVDLFARVLNSGVEHALRRGLDRNYVSHADEIAGVRGKIMMAESIKRLSFPRARACCEFDEFSYDVPHNQIIKATLGTLSRCDLVSKENRISLHRTFERLPEMSDITVSERVFRTVQLHRNNRFYGFLLEVCRIINQNLLVNETSGKSQFRDFVRDEKTMARLFEKFVRNFYRREQTKFSISAERFRWQDTSGSTEDLQLLPSMLTDISLRSNNQHLVFDTKFYSAALTQHHGTKRLRSSHIYQLFAYMRNLSLIHGPERLVNGALLYPAVNDDLNLRYSMHGHVLRVLSVDLNQDWQAIRHDLLELPASFEYEPAA